MSSIHRDIYNNPETKATRQDDHYRQQLYPYSSSSPSSSPPFPSMAPFSHNHHHNHHPRGVDFPLSSSSASSSPSSVYPTPSTPSRPSPQSYSQSHHPFHPAAPPTTHLTQHQHQHQFYNAHHRDLNNRQGPNRYHHHDSLPFGHQRPHPSYPDTRPPYSSPGHHQQQHHNHHHSHTGPSQTKVAYSDQSSPSSSSRPPVSSSSRSHHHSYHEEARRLSHPYPSHSDPSTSASASVSSSHPHPHPHTPQRQLQRQPLVSPHHQSRPEVHRPVMTERQSSVTPEDMSHSLPSEDQDDKMEEHPKVSIDSTATSGSTTLPKPDCSTTAPVARTTPCIPHSKGPAHRATIKIVQQPLHARMCGFGEKDRRPIDPPPIVQLTIFDEPDYNEIKAPPKPIHPVKPRKSKRKGAKRGRKPGKKTLERLAAAEAAATAAAALAAAAAIEANSRNEEYEEEEDDGEDDDEDHNDDEDDDRAERFGHARNLKNKHSSSESGIPSPPMPRRRGRPSRASLTELQLLGRKHSRDTHHPELDKKGEVIEDDDDDSDQEWPRYEGGAEALQQDPLYVLQVSLWSEDGTEVRNMIATPGQTDPPRLTRILMGALVVSPTLLHNENNQMGWYFSFPDLSVRTEGVYTLKFSLMQFATFEFDEKGGSHASMLIAEETSEPFTVYSAKKFPGMTESTELSKAFARQGLKIPIRNDLRVRKVNEETPPLFSTAVRQL